MDILESYLKEIKNYRLLTAEEEIELSKKIQAGDKKALSDLINSNLRLVVCVAKKFNSNSRLSIMDLIQEGNIGLMTAASKFSYSYNTRFSTYAYSWILQYMLRYVYTKTNMISIPHRKDELLRRISNVNSLFTQEDGREATITELSQYTGASEDEIKNVVKYSYSFSSIDTECSEDGTTTVGDLLPDMTYNPEENFLQEEKKENVNDLLNCLPDREREVIYTRYNIGCEQNVPTLRELGRQMGVSAETVRQIEIRAVKHLKTSIKEYEENLCLYTA